MNAITTIEKAEANLHDHFRSRLIDRIAAIEKWAVERLISADLDARRTQLLSQRVDALRKCVKTHPSQFKNPDRVLELVDDLGPYLKLRSTLAHATASTQCAPDGTTFVLFETPCTDAAVPWDFRTTLRHDEFKAVLARVSNLANQLKQQTAV